VEAGHSSVPESPVTLGEVRPRHSAPRRRFPFLIAGATVLGLWFGIVAPEVSPVAPPVPAAQVQPVGDAGPGQQADGRR
jgi:hypothetical protein